MDCTTSNNSHNTVLFIPQIRHTWAPSASGYSDHPPIHRLSHKVGIHVQQGARADQQPPKSHLAELWS